MLLKINQMCLKPLTGDGLCSKVFLCHYGQLFLKQLQYVQNLSSVGANPNVVARTVNVLNWDSVAPSYAPAPVRNKKVKRVLIIIEQIRIFKV
jgi:hypothetical protein